MTISSSQNFTAGLADRALFDAELWVVRRLGVPDLFAVGVSTSEQRAGILRAYLFAHGIADAISWQRNGTAEKWSDTFERIYGEPLGEAA